MSARRLALYRRALEVLHWLRLVSGTCVIGAALLLLIGLFAACRQATLAENRLTRERAASQALRESIAAARQLADDQGWASDGTGAALTSSAVANLNRSAQALGNLVLSVQPVMLAESPDRKTSDPVGVEMSMQGSFSSAYAFLRALDAQRLPLAIESMDCRPLPGTAENGRLDVRIKLGVVSPEE